MIKWTNEIQGITTFLGLIFSLIIFFFTDNKFSAGIAFVSILILVVARMAWEKRKGMSFDKVQNLVKILFIDDKDCQIVTNLKRNNFDIRKIDDVTSPAKDPDVQWANIIFVDYKDVGKKLFGMKEGLGLITELKRIYQNKKRYVIYSSVQDFSAGLVEFPYIRKNASYDEFVSLITAEAENL
jgi:hypothetical protein